MSSKADISTSERAARAPGLDPHVRDRSGLEAATVAVLMGGRSSEREVSLTSSREILHALTTPAGADDRRGPRTVVAVDLETDGRWLVNGHSLTVGAALHALAEVDVFFLGLHGGEGEGGTIQGLLGVADHVYTGSDVRGSAVCLDKVFSRELLRAQGVAVARGRPVEADAWREGPDRTLGVLAAWGAAGWVVKPRCGGSSVGATVVRDAAGLPTAIEEAFAFEPEVLVEELVEGIELTGGVIEDPDGALRALTPIEIRPHEGRFFDYEEKYSESGALELCPPESVGEAVQEKVKHLALLAHRTLRCGGYSRTDFMLPHGGTEPVFLETNTLPGMTPRSLLPLAAATEGIDYRTLCLWIAAAALRRRPAR